MKKVTNFNQYLLTKLFENMQLRGVKEVELVLSPRLIKVLREIKHQIAKDLLSWHYDGEEEVHKMTFLDLGSIPGTISFIRANKIPELVDFDLVHGAYNREKPEIDKLGNKVFKGGYYDHVNMYKNPWISDIYHLPSLHDDQFKSKEHPVWKEHRTEVDAKRFINSAFPKKYPHNYTRAELATMDMPDDVESFYNMFKATVEANSKMIVEVKGKDITKYYNSNNYFKDTHTLHNSCMKNPSKAPYLKMYELNPDNVSMLVLYPEDVRDKIIGRALLWKLDEPFGRYYMDRVYTADAPDEYMFIDYAKKHGYLYKSSQTFGWETEIMDGKDDSRSWIKLQVNLKNINFDEFPYLDTLQYYHQKDGILSNDGRNIERNTGWKVLTDTGGSYSNY